MRHKYKPHALRFARLTQDDTEALISMVIALYIEDPPGQHMSEQNVKRTISELTAHPDKGSITLIHAGAEIIGYAIVIHYWSNEYNGNIACIDELYIKPEWRCRGVGSECLKHIAKTPQIRFRGMQVEATRGNRRAMAFYKRHGFTPAKNRYLFRAL